jgi:hypothetical protein
MGLSKCFEPFENIQSPPPSLLPFRPNWNFSNTTPTSCGSAWAVRRADSSSNACQTRDASRLVSVFANNSARSRVVGALFASSRSLSYCMKPTHIATAPAISAASGRIFWRRKRDRLTSTLLFGRLRREGIRAAETRGRCRSRALTHRFSSKNRLSLVKSLPATPMTYRSPSRLSRASILRNETAIS